MPSPFRQAALDRISSPEQIDRLLEVTTPKGWLALLGLVLILGGGVAWSIVGRVPTRVNGIGILVAKGGLTSLSTLGSGQLTEVTVRSGDEVKKGQVVARLALPELNLALDNAKATLNELLQQHEQLIGFSKADSKLQTASIAQQRLIAQGQIRTARERLALLERKLQTQTQLLADGLITEQALQSTRDSVIYARADIERANGTLRDLTVRRTEADQHKLEEAGARQLHIEESRRKISDLTEQIQRQSQVVSPAAGHVIELRAASGQIVSAGTPVVMIELGEQAGNPSPEQGLEVILYVPGTEGKKVLPGMQVEVSPSTVRREEYGALRGTVHAVAEFPSTKQAIFAKLDNPDLAASFFSAVDNPIELRLELQSCPNTRSGYCWTSPQGPPQHVQAGTLCTAMITVNLRAPIMLVIPLFKQKVLQ
jgi:HlyD family secretion protein